MAKRISIINFKGGVGKTTLAFNLGTGIARIEGDRVLLVDMDHQSSLSIVCLGGNLWEERVKANETIDEVFRTFVGQRADLPGPEIIAESPKSNYPNLDLVSASLALDDTEIELTASHHGNAIHSEWDKRTLLCRWIEETGVDDEYDYILFDCPPATKIVSQNAIAASHGYIVPVVPEAVMERGAPHLVEMVKSGIDKRLKALAALGTPRPIFVPDTALIALAITRIKTHGAAYSGFTDDHTQHLNSLNRRWGKLLAEPYIVDGTGVSQALADGVPVYDRQYTQNIGLRQIHTMYANLSVELKKRIDAA